MFPYFILFASITLLNLLIDRLWQKNRKLSIFFAIISVIALSVFAGIRSLSVGADTASTMQRFTRELGTDTFFGKIDTYQHIEYGYSFFNYIVTRFTSNYHTFLFIHQAVLSGIAYIIAFREKERYGTKISLSILVYLFLWFNTSLNIMRQSIAIFLQLLAFRYIEQGKTKKYVLISVIAATFHTSSIIFAFAAPLVNYLFKKSTGNTLKILCSVVLILLAFFSIEGIFTFVSTIFPGFERYEQYIASEKTNLSIRFVLYKLLMCILLLVFNQLSKKSVNTEDQDQKAPPTSFLSVFSIYDVVFYALSGFIMYGYRLSYFFLVHNIIYIPRVEARLGKNNKRLFIICVTILLIGYWINRFILSHFDGTLPYMIGE